MNKNAQFWDGSGKTEADDKFDFEYTVKKKYKKKRRYEKLVSGVQNVSKYTATANSPEELMEMEIIIMNDDHGNFLNREYCQTKKHYAEMDIENYISKVVDIVSEKKVIDIYLEINPETVEILEIATRENPNAEIIENITGYKTPMTRMVNKFKNCLFKDKSNCYPNNLRVHWTDQRTVFWNDENETGLFFQTIKKFYYKLMDESIFTDDNELVKLLKIPKAFKKTRIVKLDIDFFDEMGKILLACYSLDAFKIRKQIKNIKIRAIRKQLMQMLNKKYEDIMQNNLNPYYYNLVGSVVNYFNKIDNLYKKNGIQSVRNYLATTKNIFLKTFQRILMEILNPYMDMYLLGRIFRSYKNRGQMGSRKIIFAGSGHNLVYKKFIEEFLFFKKESRVPNSKSINCIVLPDENNFFGKKISWNKKQNS